MSDLIDRQAAIDAVTDELDMIDHVPQWVFDRLEKRLKQLQSAQPEPCEDAVSKEKILKFFDDWMSALDENCHNQSVSDLKIIKRDFENLPPVTPKQPDLSEAYANAVFTWLMSYQIQSAQLKGRYTPYEVIGWVLNDWRKEHDAERDT